MADTRLTVVVWREQDAHGFLRTICCRYPNGTIIRTTSEEIILQNHEPSVN